MIADELIFRIQQVFGHVPTGEQQHALEVFARFMTDRHDQRVMVMRGAAGTGKTTLAGAIVRTMKSLQQRIVLLAPTGRAAKVFSLYADTPAFTIHRRIYRQKSLEGSFDLNFNKSSHTLFIVDEASMVANASPFGDTPFAQGQLLDDLIRFVYSGTNCSLMLIGDCAQLPPVGDDKSPALDGDVLRSMGLHVFECDLNEVLRQSRQSGILFNATRIRHILDSEESVFLPKIRFKGFCDIRHVPGDELIDELSTSYSQVGIDETMVVTRSNKRANIFNQGIRNRVLDRDDLLNRGDMLMVVKNNYYWKLPAQDEAQGKTDTFIANGDRVEVCRVGHIHQAYGFHFAEVTLTFPDYDDAEITATLLLDTLTSEAPALTSEQQQQLFNRVMDDFADVPQKSERFRKLKEHPYYNALQVKYAYAATCHKAQGGQWAHIYLDQGYMTDEMRSPDYIRWLYTAFTRATDRLYLVNWPHTQVDDGEAETEEEVME